ncbi:MAG: outer membrane beta-barrel protein [Flavobacteriaceae bacterium]|nr:outer membrane beta-barrel protein [Flavobacteriaceae bacterium]
MNKYFILFFISTVIAFAQEQNTTSSVSSTLLKGDSILSLGAGASSAITIAYEKAVSDNITVGPILGLYRDKYSYSDGESTKTTYTTIGGLFNYHFYTAKQFDLYAGVLGGYRSGKVEDGTFKLTDNDVIFGIQAGGRYYFNSNFAVGLELGYTFFIGAIRLSYRF